MLPGLRASGRGGWVASGESHVRAFPSPDETYILSPVVSLLKRMGLNPAGVLRWLASLACVLGTHTALPPRPDSQLRQIFRSFRLVRDLNNKAQQSNARVHLVRQKRKKAAPMEVSRLSAAHSSQQTVVW